MQFGSGFSVLQKFGSQQLKTDRCFKILKTDTEINGFFGSVFGGTEQHRTILKQALACYSCTCLLVVPHLPHSCSPATGLDQAY